MNETKKRSRILRLFASLLVLTMAATLASSEPPESVRIAGEDVAVLMEPETLIVGVDVDSLIKRYLPDFDLFRKSMMGPGPDGITFEWQIPMLPYSNVESMRRVWSTPRDPRFIRLNIGIFPSHREALLASAEHFMGIQAVPKIVQPSPEDPTYVAWTIPGPRGDVPRLFVRDNALVTIQVADELDPPTFVKALDKDLKEGAEGVLKGTKVEPPVITDPGFPYSFSLAAGQKGAASLRVSDPNGRPTYRMLWVEKHDIPPSKPNTDFPHPEPPQVAWGESGLVTIEPRGGPVTVELRAVAVNDLCLVSELWSKSVRLSVSANMPTQR
ncbi:MAG: hypothetical protein ABIH23_18725 [bacterium]